MIALIAFTAIAQPVSRVDKIWDAAANTIDLKLDRIYHAGMYEECVVLLRVLRGFDPTDEEVASNLVFMLRNVERKDEAIAEAKRFHKQNPKSVTGANEVARFYFQDKKYADVVQLLAPYVNTSNDIATFTMLGRAYEETGKPKEALRIWNIRIKKAPNDQVARRNVDRLKQSIGG